MPLPLIRGRVAYIFEVEDFDADQIVGPENVAETDIRRLVRVAMQRFDPDFASLVQTGDVIVANHNFGYGHPHYAPMRAMRELGISAVIAESFAPGYWREEMDEGFPQITCPGIIGSVDRWDVLAIDFSTWSVRNLTRGTVLSMEPFSRRELQILTAGGLEKLLDQ